MTGLYQLHLKRAVDVVAASLMLVLCLPVMAAFAVGIYVQNPGPVFFRHTRLGLGSREFRMLKLRTMDPRGDAILRVCFSKDPARQEAYERTGVIANDPRIVSRWAEFARKYYIDELPQFFNVLRGDMSFVGPRPVERWLCDKLMRSEERVLRASVRPGITGLAQIHRRSKADIGRRMIKLDLLYVRRLSWLHDLSILARTVVVLMAGGGVETDGTALNARGGEFSET